MRLGMARVPNQLWNRNPIQSDHICAFGQTLATNLVDSVDSVAEPKGWTRMDWAPDG